MNIAEMKEHWARYASVAVMLQEVAADNANVEKLAFVGQCLLDEAEHQARK